MRGFTAMRLFDSNFKRNIGQYIFQCFMAMFAMVVTLSFIDVKSHSAILASLGASCFVAFTMPESYISRPRCMVGSYLIGVTIGCLCCLIYHHLLPANSPSPPEALLVAMGGISVGLSTFLMVVTDTEHAPAAGIALGLVINSWDYLTLIFIITGISTLSVTKELLLPKLRDLL